MNLTDIIVKNISYKDTQIGDRWLMSEDGWKVASELCIMCGITQMEAVEYLNARGVRASLGAVKAWNRGTYEMPEDALRELYILYLCVIGVYEPDYEMPPEAPAGARARYNSIYSLQTWFNAEYGDPQFAQEEPERNLALRTLPEIGK